jgi:hypothetical protein
MIKLKNLLLEVHIDNKFQSELIDRINDEYREALRLINTTRN